MAEVIIDVRNGTAFPITAGELTISATGNRWVLPSEEHLDWFLALPSIKRLNATGKLDVRVIPDAEPSLFHIGATVLTRSEFLELAAAAGISHAIASAALTAEEVGGAHKISGTWKVDITGAEAWIREQARDEEE